MKELVERAKNYDEQAFDELILSMEKEMYLIAKSRLRNEEDIADAIQETILSCYKNIHKLKHNELFSSWTIRILINKCNDIYKKRKKQEISLDKEYIEMMDNPNAHESNISFFMIIRNLSEEEKTILTMYYYFQYTTKEISKILKIKENTIKSKIVRAKNKLRNELGGEDI